MSDCGDYYDLMQTSHSVSPPGHTTIGVPICDSTEIDASCEVVMTTQSGPISVQSDSDTSIDAPDIDVYDVVTDIYTKKIKSGIKITSYKDGSNSSRYAFKLRDNVEIKHGVYIEWWPNGNRKISANYKNNQLHGTYIECYENGKRRFMTQYINGNRYGLGTDTVEYHENGHIAREYRMSAPGKYHGVYKEFHENGGKKVEVRYVDNVYHGDMTEWWPSGKIRTSAVYDHGKLHGFKYEYSRNGHLHKYGQYLNDLPYKTHIEMHTSGPGNQRYERNYNSRGLLHGACYEFDESGECITTLRYRNGKLHGRQKRVIVNESGNTKTIKTYYHKGMQVDKPGRPANCMIA
ncbi:putative exported 24-amino acid MORn repeat [Faustovirus]|nr:putative exported 24-amino acid MORn repeat [Faustovirus]